MLALASRAAVAAVAVVAIVAAGSAGGVGAAPVYRLASSTNVFPSQMSLDFVSASDGFALNSLPAVNEVPNLVGSSVLLATQDGGLTWISRPFPAADGQVTSVSFTSASTGWAVSDAGNGVTTNVPMILHTTSGGRSWTAESVPPSFTDLGAVDFVDAHHGWVIGGGAAPSPVVAGTTDGGAQWTVETLPAMPCCAILGSVAFSSKQEGWIEGGGSHGPFILATTDAGAAWATATLPTGIAPSTRSPPRRGRLGGGEHHLGHRDRHHEPGGWLLVGRDHAAHRRARTPCPSPERPPAGPPGSMARARPSSSPPSMAVAPGALTRASRVSPCPPRLPRRERRRG